MEMVNDSDGDSNNDTNDNDSNSNDFFFLNVDNLFLISNAKNTIFQYYSLNTG